MVPEHSLAYVRFKLQKNLTSRGVWGTMKIAGRKIAQELRAMAPQQRRFRKAERQFDRGHHVKTDAFIWIDDLGYTTSSFRDGYEATPATALPPILDSLAIAYGGFTFIDLGSGLGRALLIASEWPFNKIIGIELSPELHAVAGRNVLSFTSDRQRCRNIELVRRDVLECEFPPENTVFYLFHPFYRPLMQRVVEKIERSLQSCPREVVVIYYNCLDADVLDASPFLTRVASGDAREGVHPFAIYRSIPQARARSSARV